MLHDKCATSRKCSCQCASSALHIGRRTLPMRALSLIFKLRSTSSSGNRKQNIPKCRVLHRFFSSSFSSVKGCPSFLDKREHPMRVQVTLVDENTRLILLISPIIRMNLVKLCVSTGVSSMAMLSVTSPARPSSMKIQFMRYTTLSTSYLHSLIHTDDNTPHAPRWKSIRPAPCMNAVRTPIDTGSSSRKVRSS